MARNRKLLSASEAYAAALEGRTGFDFLVHKFGVNEDIGTTSEHIGTLGGDFPFLEYTEAKRMRVAAGGSPNDIDGGTGAHQIIIAGLNRQLRLESELITLNGADASAFTEKGFRRVLRAYVINSGSSGANEADIIIEDEDSTPLIAIEQDFGQTRVAFFTIPRDYVGFLHHVDVRCASASKVVEAEFRRKNGLGEAARKSRRLIASALGVSRGADYIDHFEIPIPIEEMTDIWWEAFSDTAATRVSGSFLLELEYRPNQ